MNLPHAFDPRAEARDRIGGVHEVRVLEPSPPTVRTEPFTDDPVARGTVPDGRVLVRPVESGDDREVSWDELARGDAELAAWCAERGLGAWTPPPELPAAATFAETRLALHALAEHVVCAARSRANGKIGLRFTRGGFGTPYFGADEQVRVEGDTLVRVTGTTATRTALTTLRAAGDAAEVAPGAPDSFTPGTPLDLDRPLVLDADGVAVMGWWFGFGAAVLEQLRADAESPAPSLVQLWPEHFDLAVDLGDDAAGRRANFGASPGDAAHPEPYLYVGPWETAGRAGGFWNEPFGASLPYSALRAAPDARARALGFLREGRERLAAGAGARDLES